MVAIILLLILVFMFPIIFLITTYGIVIILKIAVPALIFGGVVGLIYSFTKNRGQRLKYHVQKEVEYDAEYMRRFEAEKQRMKEEAEAEEKLYS